MSAIFHAIVLGWLVLFSPIRMINLEERKAEFTAGSAKIQEVMDQVRERQANILAPDVRTLQDILLELSELESNKLAEFQKFSADFAQNAPGLAEEAQAAAAKAQAEAMAAQSASDAPLAKVRQTHTSDDLKELAAALKKVEEPQDRAGQSMERALSALTMSDTGFDSARQAQADANAAQRRASQAQLTVGAAREDAQWPRDHAGSKAREVERHGESIKRAENDIANVQTNLTKARAESAQAQTDFQDAQTNAVQTKLDADDAKEKATQAKADYDKLDNKDPDKKTARQASVTAQTAAGDAKRRADTAQRKVESTKTRVESAQKKIERVQTDLTKAQERLVTQQTRAKQLQTEATEAVTKADEAENKLAQSQADAKKAQAEALLAQTKASRVLATVRLTAATNALAALTNNFDFPTNLSATLPNVYDMNLPELYQTAVTTEGQLTEAYKRIRATELAMLRQIPLKRAMELTEVAKVVRPNLKPALQATATSGEDVPAVRETVQAASSEINAMVTLGLSLFAQAKGLDHGGSGSAEGASLSLDWIKAQSEQMQAMEGLAMEDSNERAKDLSGAMKGGASQGAQGQGQQGPGPGPGAGVPGGKGPPGGFGFGGPPPVPDKLKALPGRKVKTSAPSASWMYVDSWYVLGPFDNARRENIEKKFPPETVVDLNATYVGKDNQPIRWEFAQTPEPRLTPTFTHFHPERRRPAPPGDYWLGGLEYIIYYAYTELYFEKATDLWIAVGSDDFSKVWIENQLVWSSGKQQKSWRVDEGLRKVHFKQGLNRVLYRVENGWHGTDFSLVLCLK
ncbi:MAG: hypothetical protein HZA90_09885 [Verrucomicrobia bacterium]|nr:hypothetical protein [Verrucomicrobiota bacterium]